MPGGDIDHVLEKLVKDVEAAVHSLYRGEVRQATAKARTGTLVREARAALDALGASSAPVVPPHTPTPTGAPAPMGAPNPMRTPTPTRTPGLTNTPPMPAPPVAAPVQAGAAAGWTRDEGEAVMKCITAWLPVGPPTRADPASTCISAMKELVPSWGQRELAREAVRRISLP